LWPGSLKGKLFLDGDPYSPGSPDQAIKSGVGYVTGDRTHTGLVLPLSSSSNISLAALPGLSPWLFIQRSRENNLVEHFWQNLQIRGPVKETPVVKLSGGNQQKVVLAKWLATAPKLLLIDEPTKGVDVGAKIEIYGDLNRLAEKGVAILMTSTDLREVLGISDRIYVMRKGRCVYNLNPKLTTIEDLIAKVAGVETSGPGERAV